MNIVIDMNLPPTRCQVLEAEGWSAVHWSAVGRPSDPDTVIFAWASEHQQVIFTHDLDFGRLLAISGAAAPSVVLLRGQNTRPSDVGELVVAGIRRFADRLEAGALVVIDGQRQVARMLPLTDD
jgi:predicted nuclease of predicted toxin-antitoxin system